MRSSRSSTASMGKPPLDWAVKGILPNLGVVTVKRTTRHREAWNWIRENGGRLSNKYNMVLFVSSRVDRG